MSASRLERLQRAFVRSATFAPDASLVAAVTGGGTLSSAEAVDVYRRGYPARLTSALGETFEACWRVLGDEDFFAVCRAYVARTPSRSHDLSDYGETFPGFLGDGTALASLGVDAPYLADLARFEWAFKELFHAAPVPGLSPAALAAAARPDSRLLLGAAALLSFPHRVYGLWKRDRKNDAPIAAAEWRGEERLLLYKSGGNPIFARELSAPEHAALSALSAGRTLGEALEASGLDEAGTKELFAFAAEARLFREAA